MLLIYTEQITPRLNYTFQVLFAEWLGVEITLTNNQADFEAFAGAKFAYLKTPFLNPKFSWIEAHALLFEKDIKQQSIEVSKHQHIPSFFKSHENSFLPFDWFAAAFYLVSRYEEVLHPENTDEHGRFIATHSLAFKHHFLHIPVIDYWLVFIKEKLHSIFPGLVFKDQKYETQLTVDIDYFYAYRHKPLPLQVGGVLKKIKEFKLGKALQQIGTHLRIAKDPYYFFDVWKETILNNNLDATFFIHCGKKAPNDPGFYPSRAVRHCINHLQSFAAIGIHPSYQAYNQVSISQEEINRLEKITDQKITKSRQHFIRLSVPTTYETLKNCNITDDYTMGYPLNMGFRAGTSQSFLFFDVKNDIKLPLRIHPFSITDIALLHNFSIINTQFVNAKEMIEHIKKTQGKVCVLWHSHFLADRMDSSVSLQALPKLIAILK